MPPTSVTTLLQLKANPWSIGLGLALGMIMGLTPLLSLHNLVPLFILLVFRVHLPAALAGLLVFSLISPLLADSMAALGEAVLTAPGYQPLWTTLYNSALGPISQFNHTLTFGSLLLSVLLFPLLVVLGALAAKGLSSHLQTKEG